MDDHPSTHERLIGQVIPLWAEVVQAARRCSGALDLGYVGVDLVIDATAGVQVLECNAYPGLEIQNVNAAGLGGRINRAERRMESREGQRERSHARNGELPSQRYTGMRPLSSLGSAIRSAAALAVQSWQPPLAA